MYLYKYKYVFYEYYNMYCDHTNLVFPPLRDEYVHVSAARAPRAPAPTMQCPHCQIARTLSVRNNY